MNLADEEALVARAKSDIQAFGILYDAYYLHIFGYVLMPRPRQKGQSV
jgi:hypothetical protein